MSEPFRNAMLVTQGTEFDAGAERVAIDLAAGFGIPLFGVLPLVSNPEYESIAPLQEDAAEAEAASKLAALREIARLRGVDLTVTVRRGEEPSREILGEARERNADLIVLRRRGKRGFLANLLIGEMVHRVTQHAPCHVLIVPHTSRLWSNAIALATDGSRHSERAGALAEALASRCRLPLAIVSVAGAGDAERKAAQARVDHALAAARAAGVDAQGRVASGRPYEAILGAAQAARADLIVVGRRGLGTLRRALLGSTSEQVASHADGPVLIAHLETLLD